MQIAAKPKRKERRDKSALVRKIGGQDGRGRKVSWKRKGNDYKETTTRRR